MWNKIQQGVLQEETDDLRVIAGGSPSVHTNPEGTSTEDYSEDYAPEPDVEPQAGVEPTPAPDPTPEPTPVNLDPEALAAAMAKHMPQQQQPEKELTPEEIAQLTNQWNPTPDFLNRLQGGDEQDQSLQLQAIEEMRDGFLRQALTVADQMYQQRQQQMEAQLAPLRQHYAELAGRQAEEQFYKSYPGLAKHKDLTTKVAQAIQASGQQFKTPQEQSQTIASQTESVIKQFDPNFSLTAQTKPTRSSQPASQQIGGQGGAGGAAQSSKPLTPQQRAAEKLKFL